MSKPNDDVRAYLNRAFPGSRIDEGYSFVFFKAASSRRLRGQNVQRVVDALCTSDSWVIAVNVDWKLVGPTESQETRTVLYTPDWNVEESYEEHVAVVSGTFPAEQVLRSIKTPGAFAVVNPAQNLAFDVSLGRMYGRTRDELDAFCDRVSDGFEPRYAAYGE
jgi:hypothetical protein